MKRKSEQLRAGSSFRLTKEEKGYLIFAYITTKNKSEAKKIGRELLKAHLAACVNIFDHITSQYWWEGKIQSGDETVLIAKTTGKLFAKLCHKVKSIHSYSVPCILQIPVTGGNKEYVDWLMSNIK